MTWPMAIAGGAVGGGIVALLTRDGHLEIVNKRPVRRYRGYPSNTDGIFETGDNVIQLGPPDGWGWEILAMLWDIEYDGGGGGGQPVINIRRRDDALIVPVRLPPRAAGDISFIYFTQGASYPEFALAPVYGVVYPLPMNGQLQDEYLEFNTGGIIDDAHRVVVYYEEFEL